MQVMVARLSEGEDVTKGSMCYRSKRFNELNDFRSCAPLFFKYLKAEKVHIASNYLEILG